jgi:hypothetical protein
LSDVSAGVLGEGKKKETRTKGEDQGQVTKEDQTCYSTHTIQEGQQFQPSSSWKDYMVRPLTAINRIVI